LSLGSGGFFLPHTCILVVGGSHGSSQEIRAAQAEVPAPFNPDGISSEKPKDRAKYERKFNLPPQNNSGSKRRPPVKKK
jgi:hypothetical protein